MFYFIEITVMLKKNIGINAGIVWNLFVQFLFSSKSNQYLFIQWYNGYGESLLDYNKYSSMVRAGICIKPPLRNLY